VVVPIDQDHAREDAPHERVLGAHQFSSQFGRLKYRRATIPTSIAQTMVVTLKLPLKAPNGDVLGGLPTLTPGLEGTEVGVPWKAGDGLPRP